MTSQAFATVPLAIVLIVFFTIDGDAETLGWAGAILALFAGFTIYQLRNSRARLLELYAENPVSKAHQTKQRAWQIRQFRVAEWCADAVIAAGFVSFLFSDLMVNWANGLE